MFKWFVLSLVCISLSASAAQASTVQNVHLVNQTGHRIKNLRATENAITYQINHQVQPIWHTARIRFSSSGWPVFVQLAGHLHDPYDVPLPPSANGEHTISDGTPYAVVATTGNFGVFSENLDHELLEMFVDPSGLRQTGSWLVEVCDPVISDHYYLYGSAPRDYVRLADWVTPSWFDNHSRGPWDYDRVTLHPGDYDYGFAYKVSSDGSTEIVSQWP